MNTSSPKLTVPMVSEQESGAASSTLSRCSYGSCTAPPVDSCTISAVFARIAATVSLSRPRSSVGWCSPSRMWMWIIAAPAASHRLPSRPAPRAWSAAAGQSALAVSAPVGATVIRVDAMDDILPDRGMRRDICRTGSDAAPTPAGGCRMRAVVQRVSRAHRSPSRARWSARSTARPAGPPRRHPRRHPRQGRRLAAKIWTLRDPPRRTLGRRRAGPAPRDQPVHPVRRHPQGPPPVLERRRPRPRLRTPVQLLLHRPRIPRRQSGTRPLRRPHGRLPDQRRPSHPDPRRLTTTNRPPDPWDPGAGRSVLGR